MEDRAARFERIIPQNVIGEMLTVLVGCGAINSWVGELVAMMGCRRFILIDDDIVEGPNLGTQTFDISHVGMPKVLALQDRILAQRNNDDEQYVIRPEIGRFTKKSRLPMTSDIVVVGPDNIDARKLVWKATPKAGKKRRLYIDARMGAETGEVWATALGRGAEVFSIANYEGSFHKGVAAAPCGKQATPYIGPAVAYLVATTIRNWLRHEPVRDWVAITSDGPFIMQGDLHPKVVADEPGFVE